MVAKCGATSSLPERSAPLASASAGIIWTTDRTALRDLLAQRDPDLAGLYELAIGTLAAGVTLPSVVVAAHCLREVCSGLPIVLGDALEPRADVNRASRQLALVWEAEGLDSSGKTDDEDGDVLDPVPRRVFRAAATVAAVGAEGARRSRTRTAILATGRPNDADTALIGRLHKAIGFFQGWSHHRDYTLSHRPLPSVEKIEEELRIIEDALLTRLGNIADRARALRDIIARANRRTTGGQGE